MNILAIGHNILHSSDPWVNTMEGDFFDDSLQDTNFYSNIKMYSSMADLETASESDIFDELRITPYQNICFSMEDLLLVKNKTDTLKAEKQVSVTREAIKMDSSKNATQSMNKEESQKRSLPTNIVKPTVRQSYHEMLDSNCLPVKAKSDKKFAYRVSKI